MPPVYFLSCVLWHVTWNIRWRRLLFYNRKLYECCKTSTWATKKTHFVSICSLIYPCTDATYVVQISKSYNMYKYLLIINCNIKSFVNEWKICIITDYIHTWYTYKKRTLDKNFSILFQLFNYLSFDCKTDPFIISMSV